LERPHMQIQTDFSCGLISSGLFAVLSTFRMLRILAGSLEITTAILMRSVYR
jgi:hypothetical protein